MLRRTGKPFLLGPKRGAEKTILETSHREKPPKGLEREFSMPHQNSGLKFRKFSKMNGTAFSGISGKEDNLSNQRIPRFSEFQKKISEFLYLEFPFQ